VQKSCETNARSSTNLSYQVSIALILKGLNLSVNSTEKLIKHADGTPIKILRLYYIG